jgi:hypothetical protein
VRARGGVVLLLLLCGGPRPLAVSQGRGLHGRDGVRVRFDEPRDRARHHHGPDPRLAVHAGLLFAGALAAWVPESWWQALFFESHPTFAKFWGPIIGPFVAILSFVCSIGNVPLAAVLWIGAISFGGVLAFIFADLIVLPILDIYRK